MMTKSDCDFVVIVPSRLASTRLPNKALTDIGGRPMLVRVLEQALQSEAKQVVAAVEDEALLRLVTDAGYEAVLTGECSSGTHRVAMAADYLQLSDDTIVVNVQGDEPFIEPQLINQTASLLHQRSDCGYATAMRLPRDKEYQNPSAVKVVYDADMTARYFSRAPIPYLRQGGEELIRIHMGIYAYRVLQLRRFCSWAMAPLEEIEQLEQLRILWHGGKIAIWTAVSDSFGIDTQEDLVRARAFFS